MTDPSTSRRMPPARDGFVTWLDYAVENNRLAELQLRWCLRSPFDGYDSS